jgi:hypothetical protein
VKKITKREGDFARLESQQRRIQEEIETFRAGDRLGREELHERPADR